MNPLLPATVAMLALAALAPAPSSTPSVTARARPDIVVPSGALAIGQQIMVTLRHWPPGTVQLELCGNGAHRGALDCASDQATYAQVPAAGTAVVPILLAAPPVACPCLVQARNLTGAVQATAALPLTGVTAAPAPAPAAAPELAIDELRVAERGPLRGWFGFPEELTVHLTLRNPGPAAVVDPPLTLLFGPAGRAHTIVDAPALGTIEPGQAREYDIRVPMDLAVIGKHELHGRVDLPERPVAFVIETTRYPWGLFVLAAILVAIPIALRPRSRRPRQQRHRAAT
ncbi:hypothetical protein [Rhizomonospora bruguierae]|uniref:hypothetical protein n=1 Tax=Rhizomonospora bruguierae TaxID=1581705 RepID=UPI001BCFF202|nr:hypothetical protein [Micromonospora sp. NBRC 107566]